MQLNDLLNLLTTNVGGRAEPPQSIFEKCRFKKSTAIIALTSTAIVEIGHTTSLKQTNQRHRNKLANRAKSFTKAITFVTNAPKRIPSSNRQPMERRSNSDARQPRCARAHLPNRPIPLTVCPSLACLASSCERSRLFCLQALCRLSLAHPLPADLKLPFGRDLPSSELMLWGRRRLKRERKSGVSYDGNAIVSWDVTIEDGIGTMRN